MNLREEFEEQERLAELQRLYDAKNEELMRAYQLTFNSESGQRVLQDLLSFSRFRLPIDNQVDEGKRQAVLRIIDFSQLSMEQLIALYRGRVVMK